MAYTIAYIAGVVIGIIASIVLVKISLNYKA